MDLRFVNDEYHVHNPRIIAEYIASTKPSPTQDSGLRPAPTAAFKLMDRYDAAEKPKYSAEYTPHC